MFKTKNEALTEANRVLADTPDLRSYGSDAYCLMVRNHIEYANALMRLAETLPREGRRA
jgi:hypothetical protein